MENFGETIKTFRKSSDLTQSQFADRLGVHLQTISKWERGLLMPDFSLLGEIASVFSVSLETLLGLPEGEEAFTGSFDPASFGRALAEARKKKSESQSELAEALKVSTDNISKWERGVTCPDVSTLIDLANHFELPASKLYFGICEETEVELPVQWRRRKRLHLISYICAVLPLCVIVVVLSILLAVRSQEIPAGTGDAVGTGNPGQTGDVGTPARTQFNIDYWLCGGQFSSDVQSTIRREDGEVPLAIPQKEGSEFLGWYRSADYSGESIESISCENEDVCVYARWNDHSFEIRYDLRGGILTWSNPVLVTAEEEIELFEPRKRGYLFLGWFDDPEQGKRYERVGGEGAKNLTLYAEWQKCDTKFSVKYDLKGGILINENPEFVEAGEIYPLNSPQKRGYDFLGWNRSSDGSGTFLSALYGIDEDITLFAIYEPKTYLVRYVYDGLYPGDQTNPNQITFGESVSLLPVFLYGNEFLGWYTEEKDGTKVETIDESNLPDITFLYARFRPIEYSVTLDAGEGSFMIDEKSYSRYTLSSQYGQPLELPLPSCGDLVFIGWMDEEGKLVEKIDPFNVEDISLTAKWLQLNVHYNIAYELDGGIQNGKNPSEGVSGKRVPLYEPTKEGHLFLGWFDNPEGKGERLDALPEEREEDAVLYAIWQEVKKVGSAENFTYELSGNTVKITDYTGPWGEEVELIFPSLIEGLPVTEICNDSYLRSRQFHSITIPESVTRLGENTFDGITVSEPLVIPPNVEQIGDKCFMSFRGKIVFSENGKLNYIGKEAFFKMTFDGTFILPHGITTIDNYAFFGVQADGVFLPDTIKRIGRSAFECSGYVEGEGPNIFLPASPEYIDEMAFASVALYTTLKEEQTEKFHSKWAFYGDQVTYLEHKQKLTFLDGSYSENKEDFGFVLPVREKEGYTFLGWQNEEGEFVQNFYFPKETETLHAVYEEKSDTDGRSKATAIPIEAGKTYEIDYISMQSIYFIWKGENAKLMINQQEFQLTAYLIHRGKEEMIDSFLEVEKGDLIRFNGEVTHPGKKLIVTITVV